jgi:SAM-dependent methyltransferase
VTHLRLARGRVRAAAGAGATELGRALAARPEAGERDAVLWTGFRGKGRVAVLALEGGDTAGEEALAFLAARMAQWAAGKEVTVRIPEKLPLAALHLGPGDAGSMVGLAAEPGFYRGREIAPVMGWQAISWLLRPDREETELPDKVLDSLKIAEGSTVADVGAGAGYFTLRLAKRVGPGGRVIATDIQEEMLEALKERIAREGSRNVEPVLATESDPRLPEGAVDLVLMVDVYHELSQPAPTAAAVLRGLRPRSERTPAGRFVLVEYRGEDPAVPIKPLHRTTELQMRAELEPLGFRWKETHGFLPHQHVIVFERP